MLKSDNRFTKCNGCESVAALTRPTQPSIPPGSVID